MTKLKSTQIISSAEECFKFIPKNVPLKIDFYSEYVRNYMGISKQEWMRKHNCQNRVGTNSVQFALNKLKNGEDYKDNPVFTNPVRGYWVRLRDY